MVNSKNKGNAFERKIANRLSSRFGQITGITNAFRRNPDSGSFFGGQNESKVLTHDLDKACFGDIIGPANFRYSVECKHYKQPPSFSAITEGKVTDWDRWIAQAKQDCSNSAKRMAIMVKYNNVREIVIVDELPANVTALMKYQDCFVITLDAFLTAADSQFFSSESLGG